MTILTDEHGRPFEKPTPPEKGASLDEWLEYQRAVYRYTDAVTAEANRAFSDAFMERRRSMVRE